MCQELRPRGFNAFKYGACRGIAGPHPNDLNDLLLRFMRGNKVVIFGDNYRPSTARIRSDRGVIGVTQRNFLNVMRLMSGLA